MLSNSFTLSWEQLEAVEEHGLWRQCTGLLQSVTLHSNKLAIMGAEDVRSRLTCGREGVVIG